MSKKKSGMQIYTKQDKAILYCGYALLAVFLIAIIVPMVYIVIASFMDPVTLQNKGISFDFSKWSLDAYERVISDKQIWVGFKNAVLYSVIFTVISVAVTMLAAYPMSLPDFKGKKFFNTLFVITMFFNGGLIPTYLLINNIGLLDSMWAVILPGAFSVWNMIIARTYYQGIPRELREAADVDGASEMRYFFNILLPVCMPVVAVLALWQFVAMWNSYFDAMIYLNSASKQPLQLVLRSIQRLSSHIIADERGFAEELKSKWEAKANGKPQKQKEELQTINRRLNELDRLIGSLYENFISGLLPEKQYKSLMKKYSAEQDNLESQVSEIQEKLDQTKASSAHIGRFIRLIKKYKQPAELTKEMACELIDKIVVHEAVGKKPNRQQQVDIYYNFIGQFDLPLSEKEIAEARQKAEQEAAEKAKRKKNRQRESNVAHQAKAKAERWAANDGHKYPKRVCEQCGKEFYPNSTRQRICNTDCTKAHQQAEKEKKRYAEKGEHTFRQKVCKICGKPFWPSNGQEVLCSEECKTINRNQRQLAYYHRKQSAQNAGEAI